MGSARDLLARDVEAARWSMQPFDPNVIPHATRLIRQIGMSLATVDAFHLASAQAFGCSAIATSDRLLARAAKLCDLEVHDFSI